MVKTDTPVLRKTLAKMKVNIPLIIICVVGSFPLFVFFLGSILAETPAQRIYNLLVFMGIIVVGGAVITLEIMIYRNRDWIPKLVANMDKLEIMTDVSQMLRRIEESLAKDLVFRCSMFLITKDFFVSWGENDTQFRPIAVPREMITGIEIVNETAGAGPSSSRNLVILEMTLQNNSKARCCVGVGDAHRVWPQLEEHFLRDFKTVG